MQNMDEESPVPKSLPKNLDVTLLELFDCLHRTRNLSATGAELGMSQPAVSRALARLREMYGDALFIRRPRGVAPTPLAESLGPAVANALEALRATFQRPVFNPASETRNFRIAMSDVGERLFLPRLLQHVATHAPHVQISTVASTEQLHESLGSGQIDLAVGYFGNLSKQLHQRRLFRESFVYIARQGHPGIDGVLRLEQLREIPHVIGGPEGMEHAKAVERVLAGSRVKARVASRVHSFLCVAPVVASTDLIGAIPSNLAALVAGHMPLQLLPPPVEFPGFDIAMAWHQRYLLEPANVWLRETFMQLFNTGVGTGT
jgi:DNA-binding transcriptional LysR family regulator